MPIPRKIRHTLAMPVAIAAASTATLAALPATASAEPTVTAPSADSVRAGRPLFAFTTGPSGERVTDVALSRRDALDDGGRLAIAADPAAVRLTVAPEQFRVRPTTPLHAGTWRWQAWWAATDGSAATGTTPVGSFVVPATMRQLRGAYTQMSETPAFTARGSVATNVRAAVALCGVYANGSLVARARAALRPVPARRTAFRCGGMRVPERLDGRLVTLRVVVRGGGRSVTARTSFRAT